MTHVAACHPSETATARPTVVKCYRLLDLSVTGGVHDFTEGLYAQGESRSRSAYSKAQWRQSEYLLDEIGCARGSRILDVGCGNGRLLVQAQERGARAVGILIREVDGTRDYRLTSEYWLGRMKWSFVLNPLIWAGLVQKLRQHFRPTLEMLRCLVIDQSWNWQFRGDPAPTVLLRHTWEAI